ncbi:MAG: hypothetical protein ACI3XT_01950 [Butyricicoccaceae bacterium]
MQIPDHYMDDLLFYFRQHPRKQSLYRHLVCRMDESLRGLSVKVQKSQIDDELLGWLRQAYDFSQSKR